MTGVWHFPTNAHGKRPGFNDAGIDIFHGDPVGSLVRESIQNSLDAKHPDSTSVRVAFTLNEMDESSRRIADDLEPALQLGLQKAKKKVDPKADFFYSRALQIVGKKAGRTVLGIHDFGTLGLTGTTDDTLDERSSWLALVKGSGDTVKQSAGAGGSYGHGSSAPLALSNFRSVLYYTRVDRDGNIEERFQGTSRLESLPALPLIGIEGYTQDQGHFGDGEKCGPLLGDDVPVWFRKQRDLASADKSVADTGTSIFVMAPQINVREPKFWEAVAIAVIANYYYTIALGHLEVALGSDYVITSESIAGYLAALNVSSEDESEIATPQTLDRLETSKTIAGEPETHHLDVEGFGSVELLLRLDDNVTRSRIGVARSNGMLITREPWMLESYKFRGLKPFDLFVYVKGQAGSEILRQLEPPTHDAFEIKRIEDTDLQKQISKAYRVFKTAIEKFVRDRARHAVIDEIVPEELGKYFVANWAGEVAGDMDPTNYGLVFSSFRRVKAKQGVAVWGNPEDTVGVRPRMGQEDRGGTRKNGKHNFDDPLGEDQKKGKTSRKQVSDFRVDRDPKDASRATVFFNAVDKVHRNLVILRSGADQAEAVRFRPEKSDEWLTRLDLAAVAPGERKKLRLVFEPGALAYSLEARLES
jgi:hypothetical protein